ARPFRAGPVPVQGQGLFRRGRMGFGAIYGFLSCLAMVLFAKALGWFLKRDENHYRERGDD
ncbi:MAG: hypothetical protein RQ826_15705, partial [Xanthomonadales bacterium]|nr:hypothetical protein [Xanthomonadales bacterium]